MADITKLKYYYDFENVSKLSLVLTCPLKEFLPKKIFSIYTSGTCISFFGQLLFIQAFFPYSEFIFLK